jgi:hypothetical protein
MNQDTSPAQTPSRFRLVVMGCVVAALMVGVLLVLAEIVLRLAGFGQVEIYEPDPRLYWRLQPHQQCFTKVNHQPVRINSHGTRGA